MRDGDQFPRRVVGRQAIERSLRSLLYSCLEVLSASGALGS